MTYTEKLNNMKGLGDTNAPIVKAASKYTTPWDVGTSKDTGKYVTDVTTKDIISNPADFKGFDYAAANPGQLGSDGMSFRQFQSDNGMTDSTFSNYSPEQQQGVTDSYNNLFDAKGNALPTNTSGGSWFKGLTNNEAIGGALGLGSLGLGLMSYFDRKDANQAREKAMNFDMYNQVLANNEKTAGLNHLKDIFGVSKPATATA